jgi:hypothetical protein
VFSSVIFSSHMGHDCTADWLPIKRNHVVVITEDLHVLSAPLNPTTAPDDQISDISMCLERLVVRSLPAVCLAQRCAVVPWCSTCERSGDSVAA